MYEFPDDGYDYTKHLKPMGEGTFIPAVQSSSNLSAELFGLAPLIEDMEVKQSLQAGSEQFLPEDVLYLLDNPEDVEENDLQDDFMIAADASGDEDDLFVIFTLYFYFPPVSHFLQFFKFFFHYFDFFLTLSFF